MTGPAPQAITVPPAQLAVLERLLRQQSCPQALVRRTKIVLAAANGQRNEPIAHHLGCSPTTVRLWRTRWAAARDLLTASETDPQHLAAAVATVLADAPRSGAPDTFTAEQIIHILNLACTPPPDSERPVNAWTPRELADEAVKRQIVSAISPRSVGRFLKSDRAATASLALLAERQDQNR
ncbi:MAG: helix-turn-helix domain-containing protein [Roseiflexaceae bacterium]